MPSPWQLPTLSGAIYADGVRAWSRDDRQQLGAPRKTLQRQIAFAKKMDAAWFFKLAGDWAAASERLASCSSSRKPRDPHLASRFAVKAAHCLARARMRQVHRIFRPPIALAELLRLRYHRYSRGWKGLAADLFL